MYIDFVYMALACAGTFTSITVPYQVHRFCLMPCHRQHCSTAIELNIRALSTGKERLLG